MRNKISSTSRMLIKPSDKVITIHWITYDANKLLALPHSMAYHLAAVGGYPRANQMICYHG